MGLFTRLRASRRRGTATVEFAIIAPLLLSFLLGVSDLAPSTMARFKFGNATQSVGDLATQSAQLQATTMADIFAGGADVLAPYPSATLSLRISNVASNGNGAAFVYWSCATGSFAPLAARSNVSTLPNGQPVSNILWLYNVYFAPYSYNGTNTSYVSVEATYSYTAPAKFIFKTAQNLTQMSFTLPRVSTYVGFPWDGNVNHKAPAPTSTTTSNTMTLSNGAVCNYAA